MVPHRFPDDGSIKLKLAWMAVYWDNLGLLAEIGNELSSREADRLFFYAAQVGSSEVLRYAYRLCLSGAEQLNFLPGNYYLADAALKEAAGGNNITLLPVLYELGATKVDDAMARAIEKNCIEAVRNLSRAQGIDLAAAAHSAQVHGNGAAGKVIAERIAYLEARKGRAVAVSS